MLKEGRKAIQSCEVHPKAHMLLVLGDRMWHRGAGAWQAVQSFYPCFEVLRANKRNDKKTVCQNNKPVTRQL